MLLFCHVTSRDQIIIGTWEPLNLSHHCVKFDAYRSCEGGDINFLFYHATSRDQVIKGKCDYVNVSRSPLS